LKREERKRERKQEDFTYIPTTLRGHPTEKAGPGKR
jgi:hypothetical protein